jgi:O-antigen ligase
MNERAYAPSPASAFNFQEVRGKTTVIAFVLGMAIITAAIFFGRSYAFYIPFLVFSIFITFIWRKAPRPWIFLVSIVAATPVPLLRQQFAGNLICALWFIIFNMRYLSRLPKWIYLLTGLAFVGFVASSIGWMGDNVIASVMRQGAFAYNFLLAPFVLVPMIFCRLGGSRDTVANLWGLLFCLIVPSTLLLIAAKLFGTLANSYESSLHVAAGAEGYVQYQLGRVTVNFLRTEVGFILAALICAATAIVVSQVKTNYRLVAGACAAINIYLLLVTGSFGSALACLCGLAAIFYAQLRVISVGKWLMLVAACVGMLILTYTFSPQSVKGYLEKRVEFRANQGEKQDRFELWGRAFDYYLEHPTGVGLTLTVGDRVKTVIHNDYLAYTVSYSVMGGLAYTALVAGLLISFFQSRKKISKDPSALAVYLAGLSVIIVVAVNSMTDHMTVNRWYFNVIWSMVWYSYFCSRGAVQTGAIRGGTGSKGSLQKQQHLMGSR